MSEPKTDAIIGKSIDEAHKLCRTLERELAAVTRERDEARAESEALQPGIDHLRETCDGLEAERDAIRAEVERLKAVDKLAIRFLMWKLPDDVCADPCASMPGYPNRSGTNLLNAPQARAMLAYVLADDAAFTPAEAPGPSKEWCARMAELEGDSEIGAGPMANVMPSEVTK